MSEGQQEKKVSIIVPVYNIEKYIEETINCVRAQTYENWELLLVLDGCTDNTQAVIEENLKEKPDDRIHVILQKNQGAAAARNHGLKEAAGRYIAYLDADDLWPREKLQKQLIFLQEKNAAFTFTGYEFADENGKGLGKIVQVPPKMEYKDALKNTTIFTTTVMFDTKVIPKSLLEMPLMKSEATALWWKVLKHGYPAYGLNENLALYRRSGKTLSSNKLKAIRRIWNLYRRAEGLSVFSIFYFSCFWALNAVRRRI